VNLHANALGWLLARVAAQQILELTLLDDRRGVNAQLAEALLELGCGQTHKLLLRQWR